MAHICSDSGYDFLCAYNEWKSNTNIRENGGNDRNMIRLLRTAANGMPFMELLLDETLCYGKIAIPKEFIRKAGGINLKLNANRKYELLLRIAADFSVELTEHIEPLEGESEYVILEDDSEDTLLADRWRTDCYIIGKYSEKLREENCFETAISGVLEEMEKQGLGDRGLKFLEQMIGRKESFYEIDDATRPILIYKGDPICYNVLTVIAEQFGSALERAGELVEYFDIKENDVKDIVRYIDCHFKAVIGVQSSLFSIKMPDKVKYLHERIHAPQYNFIFDHPIWVKNHLEYRADNFYILTHDANYQKFVSQYFKQNAFLFPPAGMESRIEGEVERIYSLTFVGTYVDYWEHVLWIHQLERKDRFLANHFLSVMRKNPEMTAEEAFACTLKKCGIETDDKMFMETLYKMRRAVCCVIYYYRKRIIEILLQAGLQIDVFGDSWQDCPLRKYPNLICHSNVTVEESLMIWKQSKMSLNVMTWHKAGFTERMANIMLAGAVLVTDDTKYLKECYDDNDMVIFQLDNLTELPRRVKELLEDSDTRKGIAENGRKKTLQEHAWDRRAEQFLRLLE